ncbi:branched-chain amino acid aminotransferase II [Dipodascopsis tothii]|uniref:branched-chain amino acid aminotransferase II n=1 Tax=Dipodascopsis tothii TaxID=44089 RepID=UPI0034CD7943
MTVTSGLAPLDPSKLTVELTKKPKTPQAPEKLQFGKTFTDHMLVVDWTDTEGWQAPQILPYGPFQMDPASVVFHYAFECFEGMKAYKDSNGKIRLFRPDKNMERMNKSVAAICLPSFEGKDLTLLIEELLKIDEHWIPNEMGYSLYLRPTMIGTQVGLGVAPSSDARLFVIASPVGPYYPTGMKAVSLEATDYAVRAWPGGVGDKKLGANYAPGTRIQRMAADKGHQQNLWLFGKEGYVTEVGTMNMFTVFKMPDGKKELVTAPLDGTILEGVTRDSILALARERLDPSEWVISERKYTISEIADASANGTLVEAFGAGTAAIVSPIYNIAWKGDSIKVPLQPGKQAGALTETVLKWIQDIQYGIEEHPWSVVVN